MKEIKHFKLHINETKSNPYSFSLKISWPNANINKWNKKEKQCKGSLLWKFICPPLETELAKLRLVTLVMGIKYPLWDIPLLRIIEI